MNRLFAMLVDNPICEQMRQQRLVEAWAELHHGELLENWERLQAGQIPYKIAPLR